MSERCQIVGGSFFEAVPTGADAYMLKSVILDWDDATAAGILAKCRAAMPKSGRLLVVERLVGPPNKPDPAKFADLNMLVMQGGRVRTTEEFARLYAAAGFRLTGVIETGSRTTSSKAPRYEHSRTAQPGERELLKTPLRRSSA